MGPCFTIQLCIPEFCCSQAKFLYFRVLLLLIFFGKSLRFLGTFLRFLELFLRLSRQIFRRFSGFLQLSLSHFTTLIYEPEFSISRVDYRLYITRTSSQIVLVDTTKDNSQNPTISGVSQCEPGLHQKLVAKNILTECNQPHQSHRITADLLYQMNKARTNNNSKQGYNILCENVGRQRGLEPRSPAFKVDMITTSPQENPRSVEGEKPIVFLITHHS